MCRDTCHLLEFHSATHRTAFRWLPPERSEIFSSSGANFGAPLKAHQGLQLLNFIHNGERNNYRAEIQDWSGWYKTAAGYLDLLTFSARYLAQCLLVAFEILALAAADMVVRAAHPGELPPERATSSRTPSHLK